VTSDLHRPAPRHARLGVALTLGLVLLFSAAPPASAAAAAAEPARLICNDFSASGENLRRATFAPSRCNIWREDWALRPSCDGAYLVYTRVESKLRLDGRIRTAVYRPDTCG
jgi:hypothetical protein